MRADIVKLSMLLSILFSQTRVCQLLRVLRLAIHFALVNVN